jgi:hypothetical protein
VSIRSSRFGANDPSIKPVEANTLPAIATERHPKVALVGSLLVGVYLCAGKHKLLLD